MRRWGVPSLAEFLDKLALVTASSRVDTASSENREYADTSLQQSSPLLQPNNSADQNTFGQ